ncbi:MAG: Crp/Fnr family transcriptional regulator [Ferruginibacter sp.]
MEYERLIAHVSKYISLSKEEIDLFTPLVNPKKITAGEFLLREGEVCRYQSFVTRGCLKTYYQDDNGFEHITDFLIEEWWAHDLYSLFTQTASKSNIKALVDTEVLQIYKDDLELLFQKVPKLERFFRLLFQNAYISQQDQINSILSTSAEERYISFLKKKPYAEKRFSQKDIASYLGITPQFLSVLKKKIRQVNVD